jgi:hypothetical protein
MDLQPDLPHPPVCRDERKPALGTGALSAVLPSGPSCRSHAGAGYGRANKERLTTTFTCYRKFGTSRNREAERRRQICIAFAEFGSDRRPVRRYQMSAPAGYRFDPIDRR